MYYIKDEKDGKFRKTLLTPENISSDWKKVADSDRIVTLVKESRHYSGIEFEAFYLYTAAAVLEELQKEISENIRKYDELKAQYDSIQKENS